MVAFKGVGSSERYALEQGEGRSGKWSADVSGFEIKNS